MKAPDYSKEIVNQFIDAFYRLSYNDISFREYLHTSDVIFMSKKDRRIIRFAVHNADYIDVFISKPNHSYSSISPDKLSYKCCFNFYDIINYFPNNNLMQFPNYEYYPDFEKMYDLFSKRKVCSNEERKCIFKKTVTEHISFLKNNLMSIIKGEIWIDKLLKEKGLYENAK